MWSVLSELEPKHEGKTYGSSESHPILLTLMEDLYLENLVCIPVYQTINQDIQRNNMVSVSVIFLISLKNTEVISSFHCLYGTELILQLIHRYSMNDVQAYSLLKTPLH